MPVASELSAKITADTSDFDAGLKRANAGIKDFASGAGGVGSALGGIAKTTAIAATALGGLAVAGFGAVVKSAMGFESAMSGVKAASQASGSEMKGLHDLALALGSDLQLAGVDATDAAAAMEELAKGGVSVADQMGGATKGALLLFSAGADSVAQATDVAVKAMNIFGLSGAEVGHVSDLMAAGAGKSATSVGELGAAFNQSAAVAKNAGLSIEELTGTLSFLAQRGIAGSDAGTSLKTALLALQAPTDVAKDVMKELGINVRDSAGQMLPMAEIADVLKARLSGLSDAQRDAALKTIFGNDAIRVGIALYEGGGQAITDWTAKVNDAGYAAKIGGDRNDNLASSFEQLKATISTGAITIGEKFIPALRKATEAGTKFVSDFLANPAVQKGIDQFANDFAKALDGIVKKLADPAFQTQLKAWATALGDTAKAAASLAGTIKDVLGPPLIAAVGWFNDLDDSGKKNVITFGLLAVAVVKLAGPLATLAGAIGPIVSALGTIGSVLGTIATSGAAAAVALGAIVVAVAGAAWAGIIAAMTKYRDATGETAKMQQEFVTQQTAASFAVAHGANELNGAVAGFARYVDAGHLSVATTDDMARAWNAYLNSVTMGGNSTAGLTLATTALAQAQALATTAHRDAQLGVANYSTAMVGATTAAMALGATLPPVGAGFANAAIAASSLAVPVQASALAIADLSSYGTTAQGALNAFASSTGALILQVQGLQAELGRVGDTFAANQTKMQGVSAESGTLGGWLQTLQGEWDALDVAVKNQGVATDAQKAKYAELAPLIQYLNSQQGVLHASTVGLTIEQVKNWQAMQNLNASIAEGGAKAAGATSALAAMAFVTKDTTGAAQGGVGAQSAHAAAMGEAAGAAAKAAGQVSALGFAIKLLPKSFTIVANVDISAASAAIQQLSNMIPRSPAKEGPFRQLPDWMAIYDQLAPAGDWAIAQVAETTGAMGRALQAAVDDGGKQAAEAASAIAKGVTEALGAIKGIASFDFAKNSPTGDQFGWFRHMYESLILNLRDVATLVGGDGLAAAKAVADATGQVGAAVESILKAMKAITSYDFANASPNGDTLGWLRFMMESIVLNFSQAAATVGSAGMAQATAFATAVTNVVNAAIAAIDLFKKLTEFKDIPTQIIEGLIVGMQGAAEKLGDLLSMALGFKADAEAYADAMRAAARAIAEGNSISIQNGGSSPSLPALPAIPALASGGIVTKPTLALIGERGPEAVVPLNGYNRGGGGGAGGGGTNLYITITGNTMLGREPAVAAELARIIQPELARIVTTTWGA